MFTQGKEAMNAVAALHRQPVSSLAKSTDQASNSKPNEKLWARQASGEGQHWKKWRLILRNLAYDVRPRAGNRQHVLGQQAS